MAGKVLNSQSQQYLLNVMEYFDKEKENKGPLLPVQAAIERAAQAFKIGISTVNRVTRSVYEAHTSGTRLMQCAEKYAICIPKNKATDQLAVIFLDETWILDRGSQRSWQDESILSVKNKPAGARKRFIVLSAGGNNGFVK
ncbi:hypothetical protein CBL_02924 [Carabus blaptoides fortunei]